MKTILKIVTLFLATSHVGLGQIIAEFQTTKGNFTVLLEYDKAPLAVANFIQLAGKPDDILVTAMGVPALNNSAHGLQFYRPTAESDVVRPWLQVQWVPQTATMRGFYAIKQNDVVIGGVEGFQAPNYYADITGEDRIRLQQISSNPNQYQITLRYPRNWLDARDLRVKEAPMYKNLQINRVDQGRKFYAGSMTRSRLEHPGYQFQDEVARQPTSAVNLFESPFSFEGVLAMDTLAPNRNGSRFFITSSADPSLNGRFTAFGRVNTVAGLNVVKSIANTPTSGDQQPQEQMFILGITISRFGTLANAFMEGYQQFFLPGQIKELPLTIDRTNGAFDLVTPLRPGTQNALYSSSNLVTYLGGAIEAQPPSSTQVGRIDLSSALGFAPKSFFRGFSSKIPTWPSAQVDWKNARLFLSATSAGDSGNLNLLFDGSGVSGTYSIDMVVEQPVFNENPLVVDSFGSGTFTASYNFSQGPYRGVLSFTSSTGPLNTEQLTLHFDSSYLTNNPNVASETLIRRFDARTTNPAVPFLSYSGLFQKLN